MPSGFRQSPLPSRSVPSSGSAPPAKMTAQPSALEIVRSAPAEVSLQQLVSLLCRNLSSQPFQLPSVVEADGTQQVQLVFDKMASGVEPGLVLSGLRLERFARNVQGNWVMKAVVQKDILDARVFLNAPGLIWNIAVWVTPRRDVDFDGSGSVDEKDWAMLLQGGDVATFDLNGDSRIDAEDRTVFALNYLLENPCPETFRESGF